MLKVAPEGYPFIGFFLLLSAVAFAVFGPRVAGIALVLAFFMLFFFRDPERQVPAVEGLISPAAGKVMSITPLYEREYLKGSALRISIFMSPLDVHVNRSPCDGEVLEVRHTPGSFKAAFKEEASIKNENTAMLMKCGDDNILVRQIAGFLARRTVNRTRPGSSLKRGERFGIIKFSSRLDVYLPLDVEVKVRPNERVLAGESLLASPKAEE